MKKILLLAAIAIPLFYACRKMDIQQNQDPLITKAQDFFKKNLENSRKPDTPVNSMQFRNDRRVRWDKANIQRLFNQNAVIAPMELPGLTFTRRDGFKIPADKNAFLIYYKDSTGREIEQVMIKVPDWASTDTCFSGTVFVTDWHGQLLKGYKYKNNLQREFRPTAQRGQKQPKTETLFDDCEVIDWFYCVQYGSYPEECFYDYTTSDCAPIPSDPSSPPGGWTPAPAPGGTPGGITGGTNQYPLARYNQLLKFDTMVNAQQASLCVRTLLIQIKDIPGGATFWGSTIYDLFKVVPNFKWVIKMGDLPDGTPARTRALPPYTTSPVETIISNSYAASCTDISMIRTLQHEAKHAFLSAFFRQAQPTANYTFPQMYDIYKTTYDEEYANHELMAQTWVMQDAYNLKTYGNSYCGYNLVDQYYIDLTLGTLQGTTVYNSLDGPTQTRVNAITVAEATNQPVEVNAILTMLPKGEKACP